MLVWCFQNRFWCQALLCDTCDSSKNVLSLHFISRDNPELLILLVTGRMVAVCSLAVYSGLWKLTPQRHLKTMKLCKSEPRSAFFFTSFQMPQGCLASSKHEILNAQSDTHGFAVWNTRTLKIWPFLGGFLCQAF